MEEAKRMGLKVLVPDINESHARFTVNRNGDIRFGLAAIKGLGESAVNHIIEERDKYGLFKDIFDFAERVNLSTVNKRSIESLVMAGGFDSFDKIKRHQYFVTDKEGLTFIDQLVRYGSLVKNQQTSTLFDMDSSYQNAQKKPVIPASDEEWPPLVQLNKEKELIGIYLSSHPLDAYKLEIQNFTNCTLAELEDLQNVSGRELAVAGLVSEVKHLMTKTGRPWGSLVIEDYTDSYKFMLFGKDYEDFRKYLYEGYSLLIKGSVQQNTWRRDSMALEFKIKSILFLNNVRDELVNNLAIRMSLNDLDESIVEEIKEHTSRSKGKTPVKFYIYDDKEGISLELFSRNTEVSLTNDLIQYLDNCPEIEYKVG